MNTAVQARLTELKNTGGCPDPRLGRHYQDTRDGKCYEFFGSSDHEFHFISHGNLISHDVSKAEFFNWYRPL